MGVLFFSKIYMQPWITTTAGSGNTRKSPTYSLRRFLRPLWVTLGLFLARNPLVVMYTILSGLFVIRGPSSYTNAGHIFSNGCPKEEAWEEIIIIKAVHPDTQTCLLPYLKWPQRNSHCIYNGRNLVCISKEPHFGENYRIITHMLRFTSIQWADSIFWGFKMLALRASLRGRDNSDIQMQNCTIWRV